MIIVQAYRLQRRDAVYFARLFEIILPSPRGRDSDSLRVGRSGDRIQVGARFSAHVLTRPGAHPASCTMGTGSFPGVKWPERGVDHPPYLAPMLKKE